MQPHPSTPVRARRRAPSRAAPAALALAAALLAPGCTRAARARFVDTRPPEALVRVLPREAEVLLDGAPVRRGSGTVAARRADPRGHRLAFRAPGFQAEEREVPPDGLAGLGVGVALRPEGFGGPPLGFEDGPALAAAAAFLLEAGDARDAADYAARAREVAPRFPPAHRVLGDARARLGDARGAMEGWAEYLRLAPEARDAPEVARRLEALREAAAPERP